VDRRVAFRLYLITDRKLCAARGGADAGRSGQEDAFGAERTALLAVCEAALRTASEMGQAGAVAIQLREKDLPARLLRTGDRDAQAVHALRSAACR
jgi:thiamine monophosphate synthase